MTAGLNGGRSEPEIIDQSRLDSVGQTQAATRIATVQVSNSELRSDAQGAESGAFATAKKQACQQADRIWGAARPTRQLVAPSNLPRGGVTRGDGATGCHTRALARVQWGWPPRIVVQAVQGLQEWCRP